MKQKMKVIEKQVNMLSEDHIYSIDDEVNSIPHIENDSSSLEKKMNSKFT